MKSRSIDETARNAFMTAFGARASVEARAPGRVELLGNHTDYNGGLVLAAAIDRYTVVAGRATSGRVATVRSVQFNQEDVFTLDKIEPGEPSSWGRYMRGVAWAVQERFGPLCTGFEVVISGNVPLGAGLSSSASLQASAALFLLGLGQGGAADLDDAGRMDLAATLRRSENEFVGVNSGLLDQFSVLFGRADHALSLDCRTLEYERLPLGRPSPAIVVCDSKTSRRLADGMYNRRRVECERIVTYFQVRGGKDAVQQLRDVTLDDLESAWNDLDPVGRKRARHVLTENERVRQGADALKAGDLAAFGRLMSASHASSRDDFENSSQGLDALIDAAEAAPGFLGGKLSGAGWAGCTVNLVQTDRADDFAETVRVEHARRTGVTPDVHICQAAEGASSRIIANS
ncbi:MAG: galactokinase [Isosphaeraceae bacterium]